MNPTEGSSAAAAGPDAAAPAAGAVSDAAPVEEVLSWPWPAGSRCYLASMHHAEVTCSSSADADVYSHGVPTILISQHVFNVHRPDDVLVLG